MSDDIPLLEVCGLTKRFPGVRALTNVSMTLRRGEVVAVIGENGAGKTSTIEAIAWTILDTLDYKKEDIVRRGAKKGSVRVTFESSLDERDYTVYRDTSTGYYVYDPRLKARVADKKEEVALPETVTIIVSTSVVTDRFVFFVVISKNLLMTHRIWKRPSVLELILFS
jgi:ABC-type cobalamin/Fe3+-siderophores transport system ATPase subunit